MYDERAEDLRIFMGELEALGQDALEEHGRLVYEGRVARAYDWFLGGDDEALVAAD